MQTYFNQFLIRINRHIEKPEFLRILAKIPIAFFFTREETK